MMIMIMIILRCCSFSGMKFAYVLLMDNGFCIRNRTIKKKYGNDKPVHQIYMAGQQQQHDDDEIVNRIDFNLSVCVCVC